MYAGLKMAEMEEEKEEVLGKEQTKETENLKEANLDKEKCDEKEEDPKENPQQTTKKKKSKKGKNSQNSEAVKNSSPLPQINKNSVTKNEDKKPANSEVKVQGNFKETAIVPKGLPNLGNTCFYNSAVQCLLATHHLSLWREKVAKSFKFQVPQCSVMIYDKKVELEAAEIEVEFEKATTFINVFKNFLTEAYSNRAPNPRQVFEQVVRRAPRFRGWHQQDSHELLRYLIDGLRQEEIDAIGDSVKRYLMDKNQGEEEEVIDEKKRGYMKFAKPALDCVFGGSLLQIICCSECAHESVCFEPFLDLSLSIPKNFASQHHNQPRNNGNTHISKNQKKKAAKQSKKKKNKKKKGRGGRKNSSISEAASQKDEHGQEKADGEDEEMKEDDEEEENSKAEADDEDEEIDEENGDNQSDVSSNDTTTDGASFNAKIDCANPLVDVQIPEGKTIEYALAKFTALEQLRAANAYECENCCLPVNKKEGKRHKTVAAQKKYLLYSLPSVLTLHLKRFEKTQQFNRVHTTKLSDQVYFPLILDVAPYCSKATEEVLDGQQKILYSLYGIVCHSGGLSGGHYIAYVKSRKPLAHIEEIFAKSSRLDASSIGSFAEWQKMVEKVGNLDKEQNQDKIDEKSESKDQVKNDGKDGGKPDCATKAIPIKKQPPTKKQMNEEQARASVTPASWYYCSDSHVAPVTEQRALSSEGYLLFYERLY